MRDPYLFMILESLSQPIIFAHRGASAQAPENTLAAFELALAQQADAIELDVNLSADGEVIVIHDTTVDRTTNGHGKVEDMTLAALKLLDAGSFRGREFAGEKIPSLEEVFEAVGKRLFINIELKNHKAHGTDLVETVCMLVKKHQMQQHVMFSSFFPNTLSKAHSFLPGVPRGLLALNGFLGAWARSFGFSFGKYDALHPNLQGFTPQEVTRVHRLKRRVHVYTVNKEEDMRRLFKWGVDGIFTDDPQLGVKIRSGAG
jgi:glycerophosphoryl diester phosphodiesterase